VKIFIDANVLVSVLNKEYPLFTYSSRVLSLVDHPTFELYTSSLCLAIAFYFSSKKSGEQLAKKKIALLAEKLHLAVIDQHAVDQAIANPKVHDLEDGFQYYAAQVYGCSCMITEDLDDFNFAEMDVLGSEAFLKRFVFPK
jgi:predicted nucleic acid-binding protein